MVHFPGHHNKKAAKVDPEAQKLVGKMSREDLEALVLGKLASHGKITMADLKPAAAPPKADEDKSSDAPTNAELRKRHTQLSRMSSTKMNQLHLDFAQFDTNGDGEVSLDEFIKIMMRPVNGKPTEFEESELVAMFMDMDHDGGGTVCYDEFALAWAAEGEELGIASAGNDGYPDEGK